MKRMIRKSIVFILILLTFMGMMTSCKNSITKDEVDASIVSFFEAVESEDYETAAALFHKDQPTEAEGLREWFESIEEKKNIDFSSGILIERRTGSKGAAYDFVRGGAYYEVDLILSIEEAEKVSLYVTLEFIKNDNGFGMYNIHI